MGRWAFQPGKAARRPRDRNQPQSQRPGLQRAGPSPSSVRRPGWTRAWFHGCPVAAEPGHSQVLSRLCQEQGSHRAGPLVLREDGWCRMSPGPGQGLTWSLRTMVELSRAAWEPEVAVSLVRPPSLASRSSLGE